MSKILISGVKPTGRPHIGNYFGAMKQFTDLLGRGDYSCYFFIADYHALNLIRDRREMESNIINLAIDYISIGLDPEKAVIFKQSDISAHTELAWILDTVVTVPYLERAHAFKDAEAKGKEVSVGTFNYPVLMAADILIYDADVVPVGQDQKQHVEYTRDIAQKFNNIYGDTFKLPEPLILDHVATVPGTDGQKMSKSYGNTIPLFASREEIVESVMGIVTDSSGDTPRNVYAIHRLIRSEQDLKPLYEANRGKYKALKEALVEDLDLFNRPFRDRRVALAQNDQYVRDILRNGANKASERSLAKLSDIKRKIGVS